VKSTLGPLAEDFQVLYFDLRGLVRRFGFSSTDPRGKPGLAASVDPPAPNTAPVCEYLTDMRIATGRTMVPLASALSLASSWTWLG
jgi:hypothetical protein